jgi:phosphate:Na+ symporter
MQHLLNLLVVIALLVWATHIVRTGVVRLYGSSLRQVISRSIGNRFQALLAGFAVTTLVQSSAVTGLIVSSFVGRGLIATAAALAVMLGADIGTIAMVVVFSFDLSWLSPLLIFVGMVLCISRESTSVGRFGRIVIGVGLITLALQLTVAATKPLIDLPAVRQLLAALPDDVLMDIRVGAVLTVPWLPHLREQLEPHLPTVAQQVVAFHLLFGVALAVSFIGLTGL